MKRFLCSLAIAFALCAATANAEFKYYLQPQAGTGYTELGNGNLASPYIVSITDHSCGEVDVSFKLIGSINDGTTANDGISADYLDIKYTGTLTGSFATSEILA